MWCGPLTILVTYGLSVTPMRLGTLVAIAIWGVARTKEGVMEAVMNLIIVGLIVISLSLMG
jgi:hypothetical protein